MSGSEIAFFSLSKVEIDEIDNERERERMKKLLSKPESLLATILVGNNLVNVMIIILSSFAMSQMFVINSTVLTFIMYSVILTFILLLFGEILPKIYATNNNMKFALFSAPGMATLMSTFSPLTRLMVQGSTVVTKMVQKHKEDVSMDDLSHALERSKVTNDDEKELLEGILKFGGKTVSEVMRARMDVVDLDITSTFDEVMATVVECGYSRIPVFKDTSDNIQGVLYAKDLLPYIGKQGNDCDWQRLIRPAHFVPETRMIDDLLEDFRKTRVHIAVVVDEFGCTQGIVTLEDVLEEIVGDIDDEYDEEEKFYTKLDDSTWVFDGTTMMNDFYRVTNTSLEDLGNINTDEIETLAGLLLTAKGDFPKEKEPMKVGRFNLMALEIERHRIESVRVNLMPKK